MVAEEAIENGLLSEAATKTQDAIKKYLNAIPNINENYTIEVKFLETKKWSMTIFFIYLLHFLKHY